MKYFVCVNREYSGNDMIVFDSKQEALEFISSQGDEDGWCQIICGEEIKYRVKRVAYEVEE